MYATAAEHELLAGNNGKAFLLGGAPIILLSRQAIGVGGVADRRQAAASRGSDLAHADFWLLSM